MPSSNMVCNSLPRCLMFPPQDSTGCLEPEHLELLMSVVERLSEEAARWLLSKVGKWVIWRNLLNTGGLLEQPLHHPADEGGGEAAKGGHKVTFVWTWTWFYWQGSSNQQSCRGLVFSLTIQQVWIRIILNPENAPRFRHFSHLRHLFYFWNIYKTNKEITDILVFRHFGGLLPSSPGWSGNNWVGNDPRAGLTIKADTDW